MVFYAVLAFRNGLLFVFNDMLNVPYVVLYVSLMCISGSMDFEKIVGCL